MQIVIYGDHGAGKTTVAKAIRFLLRNHGFTVRLIDADAEQFDSVYNLSDDLRVISDDTTDPVVIETAISRAAWEQRLEELDGPIDWTFDRDDEFDREIGTLLLEAP